MRTRKTTTKDYVDRETGEVLETVQTVTISKHQGDRMFVKIFPACTNAVLDDLQVEDGRIRLLFWFIAQVQDKIVANSEHLILAHVDDMAAALNASPTSVRRWLHALIKRGYITRHTNNGKIVYNTYEINRNYIYKGILSKV